MFKFLKVLIYEKTNAFIAGSVGGGFLSFKLFIADISFQSSVILFGVKIAGAVLMAFCTGIASALGKEYVDYRKKQKKDKQKKELEKKFSEQYKDVWKKNGTHN